MVKRIFCDYCKKEFSEKRHPLEIIVNGALVDICDECGTKISETLKEIKSN